MRLEEENKEESDIQAIGTEEVKIEELEKDNSIHTYINSNDIVNKMLEYINQEDERIDNRKALISILDKEYIEKNNLTENNVIEFLSKYKNVNSYTTKEIYTKEIAYLQSINGEYLFIKGVIRKDEKEEYIYFFIKKDFEMMHIV